MYEHITNDKMVTKPSHYQSETGLEVIDVIEAFTFDLKGIEATDTGNVIKYICRWKQKNGLQDLEKAMWYLQHLINHVKKLEEENNGTRKLVTDKIYFVSSQEAAAVLDSMIETCDSFGFVTVADVCDLCDLRPLSDDSKYGWDKDMLLHPAIFPNEKDEWYIDIPAPALINMLTKNEKEND